jgi:hypothetical protein
LPKLELVRQINLPPGLFDGVLRHVLDRYRRRVSAEAPNELRRHPEAARLTWLAVFVHLRGRTLIDDLIDLFGVRLRICISSIMRRRSGLMDNSFAR